MTAKLPTVARILLGLVFFVFGLNGFLHFLPNPPHPGPAGDFGAALGATGYMFPFIKGTEVVVGLLLLSGRYVPLALTILAPVLLNIALFHFVLDPTGAPMVVVLLALSSTSPGRTARPTPRSSAPHRPPRPRSSSPPGSLRPPSPGRKAPAPSALHAEPRPQGSGCQVALRAQALAR